MAIYFFTTRDVLKSYFDTMKHFETNERNYKTDKHFSTFM